MTGGIVATVVEKDAGHLQIDESECARHGAAPRDGKGSVVARVHGRDERVRDVTTEVAPHEPPVVVEIVIESVVNRRSIARLLLIHIGKPCSA